ncbi:hypothetical protein PO909_011556 [Leuciscus waleckii]
MPEDVAFFLCALLSSSGTWWSFRTPLGHLMEFFGSLPLLPLACSVGDILGIFNLILSINKFLLKQTLLYYFNLIL